MGRGICYGCDQCASGLVRHVCHQQAAANAAAVALESDKCPKRFDYDTDKGVWFTYRDGELFLFHELLSRELSAVFDTPLSLHL